MRYPRRWLTLWTWLCLGCIVMNVDGISDSMTEEEVLVMVEGVEGETASLPCDLNPTDPQDKVNLILWYKDEDKDPVYSYDARLAVFDSDRHHLKDLRLKGRISFTPSPGPPVPHTLNVGRLSISDRGIYRCRVDFMRAQSRTVGAELRVVAPVDSLIITDGEGQPVPPVLSPIAEGGTLNITCTAKGGRPQPKVSWWFGESVIDDSWTAESNGLVTNTLVLSPLTRAHAHSVLVCKAATATVAVTTATVTIDMYLKPLSVELTGAAVTGSVRAGDMLDLTCTARGSRPQPVISWYKGATLLHSENTDKKTVTGVGGVSQVREQVTRRDNGARVTCRVMNPALPRHTLQEHIVINVTYPPEVELRLGAPLKGSVVKENSNLYLTCHVDANPPPHTLVFMHQGQKVTADKGGRVMINNNNLVMNKVKRNQAGEYSCSATNSQGNATSTPLNVTVLYAPVCASSKDVWAEPGKTITTQCHVQASPMKPLYFSWVWMTSSESRRIIPSHVSSEGSSSTVTFTVPKDNLTEVGSNKQLGMLQCWAENTVGRQDAPCVISVRKPSAPAAPRNCTRLDSGREVVTVHCQPGESSMSMPHTYRLQVYQVYEGMKRKLIHNVSSSRPRFTVTGLMSGQDYAVYISSHTSFGRSPYHLVESFTYKAAENRMRSEDSMPSLSTIIMFVGGVCAIVAIVVIFVITVRIKMRKQSHKCIRRTATATDSVIPKKPPSLEGISAAASSSALPTFQESSSVKRDSLHPKDALQLQPSHTKETSPSLTTHHTSHSSQTHHTKEAIPLQPIIRQPSKTLQPIIKENGRSEKSSQGRTVLFVEPPKAQSGILVNKSEVPRNSYDVYPGRRRAMKDPNGDVKHSPYVHRGSYSDMRTSYGGDQSSFSRYNDMELPPRRYRSLDDGEECRGIMNRQYSPNSSTQRELEYYPSYHSSMITSPPYSARELPTRDIREYGRDPRREMREHRALARESSRDHTRDMVRERDRDMIRDRDMGRDRDRDLVRDRDLGRDRDRDRDQGHIFAFPSRIGSAEYDQQPTSIMKRSPSMSASVGRHYEKPMRRSDGGGTYRSLPRPSKSRGEAEEDVLKKYRSLDRRFDLPFSGSLPRPEPEPEPCDDPPQHQRRYSGSPRLRFADEKHFHLYHDKEKKQSGVNDRDESFI